MDSWHDSGGEDDEEKEFKDFKDSGKNVIVFLVDCSSKMHLRHGDNETPFEMALKCVLATLRNKIFGAPKDELALMLFGTREKVSVRDFDNLSLVLEMSIAEGASIKKLEHIIENPDELDKDYGSSDTYKIHEALWLSQSLFHQVKGSIANKKIILLTNQDDPHAADQALKRHALRKAVDLVSDEISLDIIPLQCGQDKFEWKKFYRDMIPTSDDDAQRALDESMETASMKYEDLLRVVRMKVHPKRTSGKLKFDFGGGLKMAVACYNLVREATLPSKMRLTVDKSEPVKSQRNFIHPNTGAPLLPSEINFSQTYSGKKILLTSDEIKTLKKMEIEPGLKLFGFRKVDELKRHQFVQSGSFLYPDNETIKGSKDLFSTLMQSCLAKDVMAICRYKRSESSAPCFVALLPIEEVKDGEDGAQITPPGFALFHLPFVEDIRHVPNDMNFVQPDPEPLETARKMIRKLKAKNYSVETFPNPRLEHFYNNLECLALERSDLEPVEDFTLPPYERMRKRLGDLPDQFKTECGYDENNSSGTKRKATKASQSEPKKKAAKSEDVVDMDSFVQQKTVHKLKVDQLKGYLTSVGESVYGKKKDQLVNAVYDFFNLMK